MSHHEYDGKIYCDWRLSITGCEGSQFFETIYLFAIISDAFSALIFFLCFLVRKFILGDSWGAFRRGENLVVLFLITINLVYLTQLLAVYLEAPDPAPGVLWSFTCPPRFLAVLISYDIAVRAVPKSILRNEDSISDQTRTLLLLLFGLLFTTIHIPTISLSHYFTSQGGDLKVGEILERVGLSITAANIFFFSLVFFVSLFSLKRKLEAVIQEGNNVKRSSNDIDSSLLVISLQKVDQSLYASTFINTMETLYFLLLAHYPRFFTLLPFSKAFAVLVLGFSPATSIVFCLFQLFLDIKRVLYARKRKNNSSRKEDSSTGNIQLGRDQVNQIIQDLKIQEAA